MEDEVVKWQQIAFNLQQQVAQKSGELALFQYEANARISQLNETIVALQKEINNVSEERITEN